MIEKIICKNCGRPFLNNGANQHSRKYCSATCRSDWWKKQDDKGAKTRFLVLRRDNFRCQYCGRSPRTDNVVLEIDHIVPRAKGGTSEMSNLVTACKECNIGKSDTEL